MSENEFEYLDDEERELIESIENTPTEEFQSASDEVKQELREAAINYVQTHQSRMNIRINTSDLQRIKERASREGLKYQSLVKSVLHKYVTGQLVESDKRAG